MNWINDYIELESLMFKQLWKTHLTDVSTTDKEGAGTVRFDEHGNKYRWVKNATTATQVKGACLFHGHGASKANVYTFGQSSMNTTINSFAGVVLADSVPADGYCWVQFHGINNATNVLGHASLALGTSLKGVSGQTYLTFDTAVGTARTVDRGGLAEEAYTTTSAALKKVFIQAD